MQGLSETWLAERLLLMLPVVAALSVHEFAHAWAAQRLGDDTAARQGRLTLNPLEHIDPVGLLVPLLGVPFGWAKPVPIDPSRFSRAVSLGTGLVLTAAAGPLSNLLLALATTGGLAAWTLADPQAALSDPALWGVLETFVLLNVVLAAFNLIPLPPLDGSRIADGLMPHRWRPAWNAVASLGYVGIALVVVVPMLLGVNLYAWPLERTRAFIDAAVSLAGG